MESLTPGKRFDMLKLILSNFKSNDDTQKLAILCTIPKFISTCEVSENELKMIYREIGFSFVNRLLRSSHIPENCSKYSFKSVSINILKCFSFMAPLAEDTNMLENIPIINKLMTDLMNDDDQSKEEVTLLMTDSLEMILNISKSPKGCEHLIHSNILSVLGNCIEKFFHGWKKAFIIMQIMFQHPSFLSSTLSHQRFSEVLTNCTKNVFSNPPLPEVFDVLKCLTEILENCEKESIKVIDIETLWPVLIDGLSGMLRSKLNTKEKQLAVNISGMIVSLLGVDWFLKEKNYEGFFFLAFKLAIIELRLSLDCAEDQRDADKLQLYASCCKIIETVIHHCGMNEQNAEGSREAKLRDSIFELMSMVFEEIQKLNGQTIEKEDLTPYFILLLRPACSYISFEEFAFDEDVLSVMPALIKIYNFLFREHFYENLKSLKAKNCRCKEQDSMKKMKQFTTAIKRTSIEDIPSSETKEETKDANQVFNYDLHLLDLFLPGLENLSHLREAREVVLDEGGLEMLLGYFCHLCHEETIDDDDDDDDEERMNHEDRLASISKLCDIFCNFVYDKDDACDEFCFSDICFYLLHILISPEGCEFISGNMELFLSLQTICVILLYKTDICFELDSVCLKDFSDCILSTIKNLKSKNDYSTCVMLLKSELKTCSMKISLLDELLKLMD